MTLDLPAFNRKDGYMRKKSLGTYLIEKRARYKRGWRLLHQYYTNGDVHRASIDQGQLRSLGFNDDMTIEQARARASQLNAQRTVQREQIREAGTRARKEARRSKLIQSAYLPEQLVIDFKERLSASHFGKGDYDDKLQGRWIKVMELIAKLKIDSADFFDRKSDIYRHFIKEQYSLDTAKRFIWLLNLWGKFVAKRQKTFFEPIPYPKGDIRERIADAYSEKAGNRAQGAHPLTTKLLLVLQGKLADLPGQYEWMHISLWLGLRPSEIGTWDQYRLEVRAAGVNILWVYQPKLVRVPKANRWKGLPILYPAQTQAVEWLREGVAVQPLNKTLYAATGIKTLGAYSGRKGFTDLMMDRSQKPEDISMWLGHQDIKTTWKHYKNKAKVRFTA